jgi:prevent-host-death family protein
MSKVVNIHAAKTNFSKLVEEVEAGGEVTIARAGKPILKLVKIEEPRIVSRKLGFLEGQIIVPDWDAFNAADLEIASMFNENKFDYLEERDR